MFSLTSPRSLSTPSSTPAAGGASGGGVSSSDGVSVPHHMLHQARFLRPFEVIMARQPNPEIRELVRLHT